MKSEMLQILLMTCWKYRLVSFTIEDVQEFLGVSLFRARAVLTYGLQEEKIRTAIDHNESGKRLNLYDKASWHREWATKKWCGG
jgi:response regulator of citrate/malate metabolism